MCQKILAAALCLIAAAAVNADTVGERTALLLLPEAPASEVVSGNTLLRTGFEVMLSRRIGDGSGYFGLVGRTSLGAVLRAEELAGKAPERRLAAVETIDFTSNAFLMPDSVSAELSIGAVSEPVAAGLPARELTFGELVTAPESASLVLFGFGLAAVWQRIRQVTPTRLKTR